MKLKNNLINKADVVSNYDSAFSSYIHSTNELNKEIETFQIKLAKTIKMIDEMIKPKENDHE
tara:strand:+ start:4726 stop:4911 length:186 start_codon:yes stop_codon:yes gene_type:complete